MQSGTGSVDESEIQLIPRFRPKRTVRFAINLEVIENAKGPTFAVIYRTDSHSASHPVAG